MFAYESCFEHTLLSLVLISQLFYRPKAFNMITFLSLKSLTFFLFMELFFACAYGGGRVKCLSFWCLHAIE